MTADVLESLSPAQNVVRIVLMSLRRCLVQPGVQTYAGTQNRIPTSSCSLVSRGSGKTTAVAKLAYLLKS